MERPMIVLMSRDGKTVRTIAVTRELIDKQILRHKDKLYIYTGKLKGDWVWEEATIGDVP